MSERIHVTTYFLQMCGAPEGKPMRCPEHVSVVAAHDLPLDAYRQLYADVGVPWLWYERSELDDEQLESLLRAPCTKIFTLVVEGKVAGFTELRTDKAGEVQILYFGLRPPYIGRGLGGFFLDWTTRQAFEYPGVERVWVHTCSLDHRRALDTYKKAGFEQYQRESGWVTIPSSAIRRQAAQT